MLVLMVCQESPDWTEFQEKPPKMSTTSQPRAVSIARPDHKAHPAQPEDPESEECEARKAPLASQDVTETQAFQENRAPQAQPERMANPDNQEKKELMPRNQSAAKETADLQALRVRKALKETQERMEHPAKLVPPAHQDHPDSREPLVRMAMKAVKGLLANQAKTQNTAHARTAVTLAVIPEDLTDQAAAKQEVVAMTVMALMLVATRVETTASALSSRLF